MRGQTLPNAPLIEAIFELKWQLKETRPGVEEDPHYSLLIGGLYQRLRQSYPFHQKLPTALIPNEMIAGITQHRFRVGKDQWPLVQLGPGIFTVNDTERYSWTEFKQRVLEGVDGFCEVYPDKQALKIQSLILRYINAIEFNFDEQDALQFLKDQLKVNVALHAPLFEKTPVTPKPLEFDYRFSFNCIEPKGVIKLRLTRGKKRQLDALILEMIINSREDGIPELPSQLGTWLDDAHNVIEDWFFKLIEGELEKRFA